MVGGSPSEKPKDKTELEQATFTDSQRLYAALGEQLNLLGQTLQSLGNTPDPYQTRAVTQGFADSSALLRDFAVKGTVKSNYEVLNEGTVCTKGLGLAASKPSRDITPVKSEKGSRDNEIAGNELADGNGFKIALDEPAVDEDFEINGALELPEKSPQEQDPEKVEEPSSKAKMLRRETVAKKPNSKRHAKHGSFSEDEIEGVLCIPKEFFEHEFLKFGRGILMSSKFDFCIAIIIFMNAATIGIETHQKSGHHPIPSWIHPLETLFLVVYVLEFSLRVVCFGPTVMHNRWVQFDAFLVFGGMVDTILNLFKQSGGIIAFICNKIMLIRLLRLARLARVVRLMVQFRVLWLLCEGLFRSMWTLLWTSVLIAVTLYLFAILGMELINENEDLSNEFNAIVIENFSTLPKALLTLLQGLTLDSLGSVYRVLILEQPLLLFYFAAFILIVSIALMNLVTALMVESAMTQAAEDNEAQQVFEDARKRGLVEEVKVIFKEVDADNSGAFTWEELQLCDDECFDKICDVLGSDDLQAFFNIVDYDKSGVVELDEFIEGLLIVQDKKSLESRAVFKFCQESFFLIRNMNDRLEHFESNLKPDRRKFE